MYKGKTFIGIIPARGGSKGISNKNIHLINGDPLISFTIKESKKSRFLDEIIVSTDSARIAEISKQYGAKVPFMRPEHLATDESKTIDTLVDAINKLKHNNIEYDYVVLLQPTQPLRKNYHIDEAIKIISESQLKSLVSVSQVKEHPLLMRTINKEGELENLLNTQSTIRRQDFPNYYRVNGAIYINEVKQLLNENISLNDNKIPFIMDSKYDLDIDEPEDLDILKRIIQ